MNLLAIHTSHDGAISIIKNNKFELNRLNINNIYNKLNTKKTNVLIIEADITTGKSALECYELIKINKANLGVFACIIDMSDDKSLIDKEIISQIKFRITTYTKDNLPDDIKNIKAEKPGTRSLSK